MINLLLSKAKTEEVHGAGNVVDETIKNRPPKMTN